MIARVYDDVGGILEATSKSELLRNRRQVYNMQHSSASCTTTSKADPIFELIQQCRVDHMPGGRKFIRSVNFENSPSCVIATDSQLSNVAKFCSTPSSHCVWGVDPTFNMGKFYVTVTTYTYTHVVRKCNNVSPTFFGPMFIHTEKNFESFYYFFSTLLKFEPKLSNILVVSTDGEQSIIEALRSVFGESFISLQCFIHMKDNIQHKLSKFLLPENVRDEIIKDIFGFQQGSVYVKGLLDVESVSDFDAQILLLKSKWDRLEQSTNPGKPPKVYEWILKNEVPVMKESMIATVCEAAGLGSPPVHYTTNRNECMNNVAKAYVNYRKSNWVELVKNMHHLVTEQIKEVEKAAIGMGEYKFRLAYCHLELHSKKRFLMTTEQRQ